MRFLPLADITRIVDSKPWKAHLYVTEHCNLNCSYCNEHDESIPSPTLSQLKQWMKKIRDLGVVYLSLMGGEPLMHPDIVEVVRQAKSLGFEGVGIVTNAFLLTKEMASDLKKAGLDALTVSIDSITPTQSSKKALNLVKNKLEIARDAGIYIAVTGVLLEERLDESEQLIDYCLARAIPVQSRLVHQDNVFRRGMELDRSNSRFEKFLNMERERKKLGLAISSSWNIIDYQQALLHGKPVKWKCLAGYKYFFVSSQGHFWPCSQLRTEKSIMEITGEDLKSYNTAKSCQNNCGVYCIYDVSKTVGDRRESLKAEIKRQFLFYTGNIFSSLWFQFREITRLPWKYFR